MITLKKMLNFLILGLLVMGIVAISGCADNAVEQANETMNETAGQAMNATEQAVTNATENVSIVVVAGAEETVNATAAAVNETVNETI